MKRVYLIGIGCVSLIVIGVVAALLLTGGTALQLWQMEWKKQGKTELRFSEITVPFTHENDLENSLPIMAAAAIDIDNDGVDEIFLGGGKAQADALLKFTDDTFSVSNLKFPKDGNDATHGAVSLDINNDGLVDLFVARESGVWLFMNTGGDFTGVNLNLPLADNTTPLSIALGDVNEDGAVDLYVAGYLKNELVEGQTIFTRPYGGYSHLFINNGDNTWRDVSHEAGVWRQHNTFTAMFVDMDNDADSDLIIAQDTGVVEAYENTGEFPFRKVETPTVNSYPMGIGAGDYNNDGLMDFYFSNVGHTLPEALLRGDLPEDAPFNPDYMLFKNNGGFEFSDVAKETRTARIGFGWGVVFADMNLDGREDLLAAQNYARFPGAQFIHKYAGKLMLQYADGTFKPVEKRAGAKNRNYAITPVVSDFNNDGRPDIFWANINGQAKAFLSGGDIGGAITVRLPDRTNSLGAIVIVTTPDGFTRTKQFMTSQGLGSDQSADLIFGIGDNETANIEIRFQSGEVEQRENVDAGAQIEISAS